MTEGDLCGHGTACAGVIRSIAPDAEIYSVRVLGAGFKGSGERARRWAALGSRAGLRRRQHEPLDDQAPTREHAARPRRRRVLQTARSSSPPRTTCRSSRFPWRFSSVISVGSHEEDDPLLFYANPDPPVEFFARGVDVDVPWLGGGTIRATGNSFATPCISGIAALILGKHPGLTPFQLKSVMYLIARTWEEEGVTDQNDRLAAAVAAGVLPSEEQFGRLLHSIVEVARAIFGARRRRSSCSTRRRRARVCGRRRRGRGRPRRPAHPVDRPASPAGCSRHGHRSSSKTCRTTRALRATSHRGHRLSCRRD